MPNRDRERSFDALYREARTSDGRARQRERIRQLDEQRRRESRADMRDAGRILPPSRRVEALFPETWIPPSTERALRDTGSCRCATCRQRREQNVAVWDRALSSDEIRTLAEVNVRELAEQQRLADLREYGRAAAEYTAATNSQTVQWSNQPGDEKAPLSLEALQRAYSGMYRSGTYRPGEAPPRDDGCSLAKGCSGYCATCKRCLQHCTCPQTPSDATPTRRIRL